MYVLRAEIIAFGDELIHGERINTNSAWLSQQLRLAGMDVVMHTTIGDHLDDSVAAIRAAAARVDVVVCTGGLGPTADDLVREAVAAALGEPLILDERQLRRIESIFAGRGRSMPDSNRKQAMAPTGTRLIDNPHGTAPGLQATLPSGTHLFALPGVPAEVREMWPAVRAELSALHRDPPVMMQHILKCFGTGESHLESQISEFTQRDRNPCLGITVHEATISLRLVARGRTEEDCRRHISDTAAQLRQRLGTLVFGEGDDELEDVVVRELREQRVSLAVFESGTPGWLSHWLRRADPVGEVFRGGTLMPFGSLRLALHDQGTPDAGSLAESALATFDADWGLGLSCSHYDPAVGPLYRIELAVGQQVQSWEETVAGHPGIWHPRAAKMALNALRLQLDSSPK